MPRFSLAAVGLVVSLAAVGCRPLSQHPIVVEAVEEVRGNTRVAEILGAPVTCSTAVRGTANETDGIASLQFDASGSKGKGVIAVEGKKTRDEWGVTMLELRPAGGDKISLTADLEARTGTDTPKFDPGAQSASSAQPAPPPGDIEIVLPPGPPGQ
ncbi:MAG: cytochrome c oxidase assembly factor 1 family protein [Planctomycetia bacterium]|nr:cytochrome c oxidase assembly factor 1 family protein [Planctomycetia bacterium]